MSGKHKKKSSSNAMKGLALGTALSLGTFGFTAIGTGAAFSSPTVNTAAASLNTTKVIKLANGKTRVRVDLADNLRGKTVIIRTSRIVNGERRVFTLGKIKLTKTGKGYLTVSRQIRVDDRIIVRDSGTSIVNSKVSVIDDRTPAVVAPVPTPAPPASGGGSAPATTVAPAIASATITGTPVVGQVLTAGSTGVTGTPTPTLTYLWKADGTDIAGATSSTFTLTSAQLGAVITVVITATNTTTPAASATSAGTSAVTNSDVTAYDLLVTEVNALVEAEYTTASWALYEAEVIDLTLDDQNTQAEVDAAAQAIQDALDLLVLEPAE